MPDPRPVDLRSDTVTRPSPAMRQAMADAEVDDDVLGKDPTADRLERRIASLLGKDAALFFPSGTQANQTAVLLHTRPGTEAVCEADAHVFHYEFADVAWLAGVQLFPVASKRGVLDAADVAGAVRPGGPHQSPTSLICVENTHLAHGGVVVPLAAMQEIRRLADSKGLPVHLDGARLWNASIASRVSVAEYGACADTVMVSLSKGLGCPVGSVLAGPEDFIRRAWSVRKRLGGGMRQIGILAAAGLYALDHHVDRLAEDHARALRLAQGCRAIDGLTADIPDTNIVLIRPEKAGLEAEEASRRLAERGVRILPFGEGRLRAVTHLDVDDEGIARALQALADVLS